MSRIAVFILLAACGRLGFQELLDLPPGDGDAGEAITVIVTSDESSASRPGLPAPDAVVLIERGGVVLRTATDATGAARFGAAGVVAYHVYYRSTLGDRLYTVATPAPGTIELGGRATPAGGTVTLRIPNIGNAEPLSAGIPANCGGGGLVLTGSTVYLGYEAMCEGTSVRVVLFSQTPGNGNQYLDAGTLALVDGTTYTLSGRFASTATETIQISNVPTGLTLRDARPAVRTNGMVTPLTDGTSTVTRNGRSATVTTLASPGGDTLHVSAGATVTTPVSASSATVQITPASVGATTSFDASGLLPPLTSYTYAHPTLSWTGGDGSGTLILIEASMHVGPQASGLDWIVYADPAATEVAFPQLPDELGVSMPIDIDAIAITKLDVPGESPAGIARTLDRTIRHWPSYDYVTPPLGNAMTRLTYSPF